MGKITDWANFAVTDQEFDNLRSNPNSEQNMRRFLPWLFEDERFQPIFPSNRPPTAPQTGATQPVAPQGGVAPQLPIRPSDGSPVRSQPVLPGMAVPGMVTPQTQVTQPGAPSGGDAPVRIPGQEGAMTLQEQMPLVQPDPLQTPSQVENPVKPLMKGAKGEEVENLQRGLLELGYGVGRSGVDGDYGPTTTGAVKKFQQEYNLPVTGDFGELEKSTLQEAINYKYQNQDPRGEANESTKGYKGGAEIRSEDFPFIDSEWNLFTEEISKIESGGKYNIVGGYNDHYDGKYQMGKDAKLDAGRILGIKLGHSASEREAFRNDPELQERAFKAFTKANYMALMRNSEEFRNMTPRQRMGALAYAHNQGAGGTAKFLRTGEVGEDGFGTKGTKYTSAVTEALKGLPEGGSGPRFIGGVDQKLTQSAEDLGGTKEEVTEGLEELNVKTEGAKENPVQWLFEDSGLMGLNESNVGHQETIKGFFDQAVPGWVTSKSQVTSSSKAWCAAFANHVLGELGYQGLNSDDPFDKVRALEYLKVGTEVKMGEAQAGDIVVTTRGDGSQSHVAFFVGFDEKGNYLLLGGNQSNKVNIQKYAPNRVRGIRRLDDVTKMSDEDVSVITADMALSQNREAVRTSSRPMPRQQGADGPIYPDMVAEEPTKSEKNLNVQPLPQAKQLGMIGGVRDNTRVWQSFGGSGMAHSTDYVDYSQLFREYTTTKKKGYIEVGKTEDGQTVYAAPDYAKDKAGNYLMVSKDDAVRMAGEMGSIIPTREWVQSAYKNATRVRMPTQPIYKTPGSTGDSALYTSKINEALKKKGIEAGAFIVHGKEFFVSR